MDLKKSSITKIKIWWVISIISLISGFIYSMVMFGWGEYKSQSFGLLTPLLNFLNFFSAGIIFFFSFASLSYIILYKSTNKKDWIIFTIVFYIINLILGLAIIEIDSSNFWVLLIFPLIYSPFIYGFAIQAINSIFNDKFELAFHLVGQILFFMAFLYWSYLEFFVKKIEDKKNIRLIKRILLIFIFLMLIIGVKSCMSEF